MLSTAICAASSFHSSVRSFTIPSHLPYPDTAEAYPASAEGPSTAFCLVGSSYVTAPSFRELGVSDPVVAALEARGIIAPFPIQTMVIEDATSGRDTLARSKTGSGKTLG